MADAWPWVAVLLLAAVGMLPKFLPAPAAAAAVHTLWYRTWVWRGLLLTLKFLGKSLYLDPLLHYGLAAVAAFVFLAWLASCIGVRVPRRVPARFQTAVVAIGVWFWLQRVRRYVQAAHNSIATTTTTTTTTTTHTCIG
jgi:branched-subunit amino acid ABC-type transport system permease component